jgi:hypothetical protein
VHGLGNDSDSDDGGDGYGNDSEVFYDVHLVTALFGERVQAIAAGLGISCAVTEAGGLYTWGHNYSGNLGHGDVRNQKVPKLVSALHGIQVVKLSFHADHTLALAADNSVYSFGEGPGLGISRGGEGEKAGKAGTATRNPRTENRRPRLYGAAAIGPKEIRLVLMNGMAATLACMRPPHVHWQRAGCGVACAHVHVARWYGYRAYACGRGQCRRSSGPPVVCGVCGVWCAQAVCVQCECCL